MKKILNLSLVLLCAIALAFAATACGEAQPVEELADTAATDVAAANETELPVQEDEPEPEAEAEPAVEVAPLSSVMVTVESTYFSVALSEDLDYTRWADLVPGAAGLDVEFSSDFLVMMAIDDPGNFAFADAPEFSQNFTQAEIIAYLEALATASGGGDFVSFELGEVETFTVNGVNVYEIQVQRYRDGTPRGDRVTIFGLFEANNTFFEYIFNTEYEVFGRYYPHFRAIVNSIEELYVPDAPTQMLYDQALLSRMLNHVVNLEFAEIVAMTDEYLATSGADEDDIAHTVKELAQRADELLAQTYIHVDSFDGQVTIYYPGIRAISQSVNALFYLRPGSVQRGLATFEFHFDQGFYRNGWLFFDRASIRLANGTFYESNFDFTDKIRDVLTGGTIREIGPRSWGLGRDFTRLMSNLDVDYEHVIRFTNRAEDNHVDFELSSTEVRAMKTMLELYTVISDLGSRIPREFR
ncbi:MAG: hypothetical protein FWB75_07940 [Oscillospiraceae bacterium]|nr:hypothetical protein [Oscillospiraceae bacterium]